jgi:hypothetical protein
MEEEPQKRAVLYTEPVFGARTVFSLSSLIMWPLSGEVQDTECWGWSLNPWEVKKGDGYKPQILWRLVVYVR